MTTPTRGSTRRGPAATRRQERTQAARRKAKRRLLWRAGLALLVAVVGLYALTRAGGDSTASGPGGPPFAVGSPGPGSAAPPIRLKSTAGGSWDLAKDGGAKTVLLYFQEGIGCQPCWDQMTDIEERFGEFEALGVDEMVTIAVADLSLLRRKVSDESIGSTVLADPEVSLGPTYTANQYGMMGTSTYGHTFIVVGPDGTIRWRADYGGAPHHTMYVSPEALLEDLRQGLAAAP